MPINAPDREELALLRSENKTHREPKSEITRRKKEKTGERKKAKKSKTNNYKRRKKKKKKKKAQHYIYDLGRESH